ncbi:MAG TPA: glycosyltransferase family 39 protein [Tepidisphaeraceae bacterium]
MAVIALCAVCVAVGVFFRLYRLGYEYIWYDETWTIAHIFGHRISRAGEEMFTNRTATPEELRKYTNYDASSTMMATVRRLAGTDTIHPPLYYVLLHFWAHAFGDSAAALRLPGAIFSIGSIGACYVLCRMLFPGTLTPAIAAALLALSPFQQAYAEEARQYSLLGLLTLVSSIALVAAVRRSTWTRWLAYAASVSLGMYTQPLFPLVIAAHAIYAIAAARMESNRPWRRTMSAFGLAAATGLATFIPWAVVMYRCREVLVMNSGWVSGEFPKNLLLARWLHAFAATFVDTTTPAGKPPLVDEILWYQPLVMFLILVSLLVCLLRMPSPQRVLVLGLIIVPFAALAVPDLLVGGRRSGTARYFTATLTVLPIPVAWMLAAEFANSIRVRRAFAACVALVLAGAGMLSLWQMSGQRSWWPKGTTSMPMPEVIEAIDQVPSHTVVSGNSENNPTFVITLARYVRNDTQFILLSHPGSADDLPRGALLLTTTYPEKLRIINSSALQEVPGSSQSLWRWPLNGVSSPRPSQAPQ